MDAADSRASRGLGQPGEADLVEALRAAGEVGVELAGLVGGEIVGHVLFSTLGVTPDSGCPGGVREWCINTAAIDPFTKSVMANSEDGNLYRWDLTTNTFTQVVKLSTGIGEAYTPTVIGADGTVYAINNATLFAVGK